MTQTTDRPPLGRPRPSRPRPTRQPARGAPRPNPVGPGLVAAAWAAGAGLVALAVPVLLVWATDSRSGSGAAAALRSAGRLWVLAHGASLDLPGGTLGLTPLGLVALPLALLGRAGAHGARSAPPRDLRDGLLLVAAIAAPYAVLVAVVAAAASSSSVHPAPVQALLGGLLVGALGAGAGVARGNAWWRGLRSAVPARVRAGATAAGAALAVLVGAGALLTASSLGAHLGRAAALARASDPGLVGGVALLALGVALAPNLAVWGASWWAGPGFAVGVGTSVGPFGTTLGAVPALPVLAALPTGSPPPWLAVLALAVPLAAGALAGLLVARRSTALSAGLLDAALVGPAAGLALLALAWLSGGPAGGVRLTDVGPSPWRVGLAVAVEVAAGAAAAAAVALHRRGRAAR